VVAAAAGFAAANADTWASELGVLSRRPPRSITTGRELPAGASGGVTPAGTLASLAGSCTVGLWLAAWFPGGGRGPVVPLVLCLVVTAAGTVGSVVDSLLGATIQALYKAPDDSLTEHAEEGGSRNRLVRGLAAVNNDVVNFASTMTGAVVGGLSAIIGQSLGLHLGA